MLSTIFTLLFFAAVFSTLVLTVFFANNFGVFCVTMLMGYLATLVFLAHRKKQNQAQMVGYRQSQVVALPSAPVPFSSWREEMVVDNGVEYQSKFR
jgi:hypothetical protein